VTTDLICDVISCCVWSADAGSIWQNRDWKSEQEKI